MSGHVYIAGWYIDLNVMRDIYKILNVISLHIENYMFLDEKIIILNDIQSKREINMNSQKKNSIEGQNIVLLSNDKIDSKNEKESKKMKNVFGDEILEVNVNKVKRKRKKEENEELKEESKEESKGESKKESKGESKEELKEESKEDSKEKSKDESKEEIKGETKDELKKEIKEELKKSKENTVYTKMNSEMSHFVVKVSERKYKRNLMKKFFTENIIKDKNKIISEKRFTIFTQIGRKKIHLRFFHKDLSLHFQNICFLNLILILHLLHIKKINTGISKGSI